MVGCFILPHNFYIIWIVEKAMGIVTVANAKPTLSVRHKHNNTILVYPFFEFDYTTKWIIVYVQSIM